MTTSEGIRLVEEKLFDWIKTFIQMLPNVMLAALIVVIAWLLARLARYWSKRLVAKMTDSLTLRRLIGNSVYLLVVPACSVH
ncbi:MAG: hypothetical protein IPH60_00035 [Flavobacteriales bacterium]|nr:hypothetical protein [Flavobacteriales bacterium]